jgi:hypothetical protein
LPLNFGVRPTTPDHIKMKQEIREKFEENVARVRNLVNIYQATLGGAGRGRRGHQQTDVLRAATVLLHAATEDLLRSLAYWKLPNASANVLSGYPLVGTGPSPKFGLGDLAAHRGISVEEVIKNSVHAYLERSNYNNTTEVSTLLTNVGLNVALVNHTYAALDELMQRRHQIVHRADRDEAAVGRGNHRVRTIGTAAVNRWIDNVNVFATAVLDQIPN